MQLFFPFWNMGHPKSSLLVWRMRWGVVEWERAVREPPLQGDGEKMGPRIREDTEGVTPIQTFPPQVGRVKRGGEGVGRVAGARSFVAGPPQDDMQGEGEG